MKSKVKYAVLVLVIGLLGLVILPNSIFAGPGPELYDITISDSINSNGTFETAGNKPGTRFNPFPKGEEVPVTLTFDLYYLVSPPDEEFRTGTIPEVDYPQDLDGMEWEFHHIKISGNSLECRFDLFYEDEEKGAWDHYVLGISLKLTDVGGVGTYYDENATINWTHYTENTKPRGQNPKIEFQHLEYSSSGELTITITEAN